MFYSKSVAVTVDWLVEAMDEISMTISKQWVGLILLPAISSIAGPSNSFSQLQSLKRLCCTRVSHSGESLCERRIDAQYQCRCGFDHSKNSILPSFTNRFLTIRHIQKTANGPPGYSVSRIIKKNSSITNFCQVHRYSRLGNR